MALDSLPAARLSRARHRKARPPKQRRLISGLLGVTVLLVGTGLAVLFIKPGPARPKASPGQASTTIQPSATLPASTTTTSVPASTSIAAALSLLSPTAVTVEVLNGSGAPGAATSAASQLAASGFDVNGTGDANSYTYRTSVVEYPPGLAAEAQTLIHYLTGSIEASVDDQLSGQVLDLILGSTFRGVLSA